MQRFNREGGLFGFVLQETISVFIYVDESNARRLASTDSLSRAPSRGRGKKTET